MKNILSVDESGIILFGLEQLVKRMNRDWCFESASSYHKIFSLLREPKNYDLIILPLTLEGRSGLEILQDIKNHYPQIDILIFTNHDNLEFVRRALKLGASGYLLKQSSEIEIEDAVKTILNGGKFVNEHLRDELVFSPEPADHSKLSAREFEVLIRIGKGLTTKEIASQLSISANTVDTYRARIKDKMDISRDSQMIHYCISSGLISIPNNTRQLAQIS